MLIPVWVLCHGVESNAVKPKQILIICGCSSTSTFKTCLALGLLCVQIYKSCRSYWFQILKQTLPSKSTIFPRSPSIPDIFQGVWPCFDHLPFPSHPIPLDHLITIHHPAAPCWSQRRFANPAAPSAAAAAAAALPSCRGVPHVRRLAALRRPSGWIRKGGAKATEAACRSSTSPGYPPDPPVSSVAGILIKGTGWFSNYKLHLEWVSQLAMFE